MAKKKSILESKGFKNFMKYLYGIGAAVVIAGALFKIMHWPGAAAMLIAGMGTEVIVFLVSAFEPLHEELDWSKVYPELAEETDTYTFDDEDQEGLTGEDALALAEEGMKQIELTPDLFESLSGSLNGLKDNVSSLANIENATVATNEYADSVRTATGKVSQLGDGYTAAAEVMNSLASTIGGTSDNAAAYHEQVTNATKNLSSLNAVYEINLNDAQSHIASINKFYGALTDAMNDAISAAEGTKQYQQEVADLTSNLRSLNGIYGNMLAAMAGTAGGNNS